MQDVEVYKALANEKRLAVLEWLKDPPAYFPPQVDGDLVSDGVCALFLAEKAGISQATLSEHMKVLTRAGLVRGKKIRQWTFYSRDEERIEALRSGSFARL